MRTLLTSRWVPKDSTAIEHPLGVVYTYLAGARPAAVAYAGKGNKSVWHHSYFNLEARDRAIKGFFEGLEAHEKSKADRKASRNKPHALKVGDIFVSSWGYDQTNVDFYAVVKTSERCVWLQKLSQNTTETGFLQGTCVPVPGTEHGEITKHVVQYGSRVSLGHQSGSKWDGKPEHWSAYA